jgi:hypothetical protein
MNLAQRQATSRASTATAAAAGASDRARPAAIGAALPRAALRLLAALAEPGAAAIPDPTSRDKVVVRGRERGVSLGRGSYPAEAAMVLIEADLATTSRAGASHSLTITEAGRAHLRRREAGADAPFQAQHREIVAAEFADDTGRQHVAMNAAESPLAWLHRRRDAEGRPLIDDAQFEAGERLRRDVTQASLLPSVSASWDAAIGRGAGAPRDPAAAADTVIAARQRVRTALHAIGGDFADLLLDLCAFLKGLEQIERERHWPPRSGKIVVRLALARLAEHYGLGSEARGYNRFAAIRTWRASIDDAA